MKKKLAQSNKLANQMKKRYFIGRMNNQSSFYCTTRKKTPIMRTMVAIKHLLSFLFIHLKHHSMKDDHLEIIVFTIEIDKTVKLTQI